MYKLRYLLRFVLLAAGFALTTMGLMTWQARNFAMEGLWFDAPNMATHPLHLLILGIAMIPPTLWEIFVLENSTQNISTNTPKPGAE